MNTVITIVTIVSGCLCALVGFGATLEWTAVWQRKEYRLDRMRYFLSLPSGRRLILGWRTVLAGAVGLITLGQSGFSDLWQIIVLSGASLIWLAMLIAIARRRVRPVWTSKALAILAGGYTVAIAATYLAQLMLPLVAALAWAYVLIPVWVSLGVAGLSPITRWQRQRVIIKAKQRLRECNPIVIGITGSYGKSSTKRYLATLLEKKYHVLSTPKNINVDIGVAQTILDQLTPEHDVFIVEMGAYRVGEIAAICDLVSPIIGIVTAVSNQHIALFGSRQQIADAKAELLESLPSSGIAVINADDATACSLADRTQANVKLYSTKGVAPTHIDQVTVRPEGLDCRLHIGPHSQLVQIPLYGQQVLSSVAASLVVADYLGLNLEQIAERLAQLESQPGTMHRVVGRHLQTVIDDNYNANPDGFLAALDYLSVYTDKQKIVITPGMQELGSESNQYHRIVGERIAQVADRLIITQKDFADVLGNAARQAGLAADAVIVSENIKQLITDEIAKTGADDVILLEGRVQRLIVETLLGRDNIDL